jgi:hypothetical protein
MDDPTLIGGWASGVWLELGAPSTVAASTISGYAVQESTLGRLNSLIGTCFSGSGYLGTGTSNYQIGPFVTNTELALIGAMYTVSYYRNLAQAMMGATTAGIPWTTIKEEGSTIQRANGANIGEIYLKEAKTANDQLNYLVNAYRQGSQGGNMARSIDYYDLSGPTYGATVWP